VRGQREIAALRARARTGVPHWGLLVDAMPDLRQMRMFTPSAAGNYPLSYALI
jgi:hypothetical protein